MANLKEVRGRIVSVRSTQQITKAMKMVAAAKLRKAQGKILQIRPYAEKLNDILDNVTNNSDGSLNLEFSQIRPIEKVLISTTVSETSWSHSTAGRTGKSARSTADAFKSTAR